MVVRRDKKKRKFFGTRRWGAGNIKNARGAGDRGGVGMGGRKHKFTYITAKTPYLIGRKGFSKWNQKAFTAITLRQLNLVEPDESGFIELPGRKVLSNGEPNKGLKVHASAFSKRAAEKITAAGGQAVVKEKAKDEV